MGENKRQQVRRLFMELAELSEAERAAGLERACGGDAALRAEVEALLGAERAAGAFLSSPTAGAAARAVRSTDASEAAGALIGRYKLLEQIGEGGMGTIWMAEQREPVKRRVALKIIKLGMDTKQVIARFEAERQALAMMDHPHIAKVLDAGATDTGRPYFVMEYIKGIPILEYCDKERLDTTARLALFTSVCHAIQHAHQKGIIHRDIKPSNVLVTLHDGVPVPKVIDFGIAKATNSELTTKTLFTEHRQMIGTPAYMSPEQAEMSGLDIDTRSDIYSLGVLLYELLTGTTPFDTKALLESGFAEMMRAIREDEPHKPSTRISSLGDTGSRTALQRKVELKKLSLLLRGDLDWIVMKCLEKDRTRRYETANGLAADIKRHLHDEPITAGAPSASYKLHKFVKRNRGRVIAASAVLAALLIAVGGTSWGLVEKSGAATAQTLRKLEDEQRANLESARLGRNADAVAALLDQCEAALRAGDAAKAQISMDAARKRSVEGGTEKDAERLTRLAVDLELLTELDAIDRFRWTWKDREFAPLKLVVPRMRDALEKFGLGTEVVQLESASALVNASNVRERIVAALDWVLWERRTTEAAYGPHALLRRLDDDPFRNEVRDTFLLTQDKRNELLFNGIVEKPAALEQPPEFAAFLGEIDQVREARRVEMLQAAVIRRPRNLTLLMTLGRLAFASPDPRDELRWCQAALAASSAHVAAYCNLGVALKTNGRLNEAIACQHRALEIDPHNSTAYLNLANALCQAGQFEAALVNNKKAIELDPTHYENYCSLGNTLCKRGLVEEGLVELFKSIALDPMHAEAHYTIGVALQSQGKSAEAIEAFRRAFALDPAYFEAALNLGTMLRDQGRPQEALPHFEKAIALKPSSGAARANLGCVLADMGRFDEAIIACKQAIESEPTYAQAYFNLGSIYASQSHADAAQNFRKFIELDPDDADAHCRLALALRGQGELEEALAEYKRGHALGSARRDWKHPSAQWIRETEAEIAKAARLQPKLDDLLAGRYRLRDNAERLEFADFCQDKKLNCAATRLYAEALAADPKLGEEVDGRSVRYNAACVAILCAQGPSQDAASDDEERVQLRRQALEWFRADLTLASERLAQKKMPPDSWSQWFCNHSLKNAELVGIREPAELAKLSADEQESFTKLWEEIDALAQSTQSPLPGVARAVLPPSKPKAVESQGLERAKRLNDLAREQWGQGNLAEAEVTQRESLQIFERLVKGDHLDLAFGLETRAWILRDSGRAAEAEPIALEALAMIQGLRPGESERVALALFTLGTVRERLGRYQDALQSYETSLAMNRKLLPASHKDVMVSMTSLARAYYFVGKYEQAVALFEEALTVEDATLGRSHPETLMTIANLGANYRTTGRDAEAVLLLEEAWKYVKQYPQLQFVDWHLVNAYIAVGAMTKAQAMIDEMITEARATLPKESLDLAAKLTSAGLGLTDAKTFDAAERLLREALAIREAAQPDAWTTFNTQSALGGALLGQEKLAEAEPLLLAGYRGMKERQASIPPNGSNRIDQALERLVKLYEARGDAAQATTWRTELERVRVPAAEARSNGGKR